MSATPKQKTGQLGENLAIQYLMHKEYTILARNWRYGKGELDIIAKKDQYLVIVEVKTRTNKNYGEPFDDVSEHLKF